MKFYSTNRNLPGGFSGTVAFGEALFRGQAPDGGLFMPEELPRIDLAALAALKGRPFAETAFLMIQPFLRGEMTANALSTIVDDAFDFAVPLEAVADGRWIMRLDRGPTASFKDFAARLLARLMRDLRPSGERLTVLVATSGDTGSAVGEAFKGLPGIDVWILYPRTEVSATQKAQLDSIGGNVRSLAVDGKFDDCQAMVKRAFADPALASLRLTSANSINFGRILGQMAYYAYAWTELADGGELTVSVPSGNFGNALACEYARRMGLPIRTLIMATNANDEFPRFLETGVYEKISPSKDCLSNAMNVGHPSNLARFFELYGGTVDKDGVVHRVPDVAAMREHLWSTSVSDDETLATMKMARETFNVILEPHGAVAWAGLERYREATRDAAPAVVLETAHPAKFPEVVRETLGLEPETPETLKRFRPPTTAFKDIAVDDAALKSLLLSL
jgi:threonine synthase